MKTSGDCILERQQAARDQGTVLKGPINRLTKSLAVILSTEAATPKKPGHAGKN